MEPLSDKDNGYFHVNGDHFNRVKSSLFLKIYKKDKQKSIKRNFVFLRNPQVKSRKISMKKF